MWAQESRLFQDRTPLAIAFSLSLSIRSAQHMWTSSWNQNKQFVSQRKIFLERKLVTKVLQWRSESLPHTVIQELGVHKHIKV